MVGTKFRLRPGEKLMMTGGGYAMNEFQIVRYMSVRRSAEKDMDGLWVTVKNRRHFGKPRELETREHFVGTPRAGIAMRIGRSRMTRYLPLGYYTSGFERHGITEVRDAINAGMFSTIYNQPIVALFQQRKGVLVPATNPAKIAKYLWYADPVWRLTGGLKNYVNFGGLWYRRKDISKTPEWREEKIREAEKLLNWGRRAIKSRYPVRLQGKYPFSTRGRR